MVFETLKQVEPGADIGVPVQAIVLGRGGDITLEFHDGAVASFAGLPSGHVLPFAVKRIVRTSSQAVYVVPTDVPE